MKERKEAREETMKEKLRKLSEGFEASFDYDKAISVWEQIEDFEEVARVKGLKADFDAIARIDLSPELPPLRDKQTILLKLLALLFFSVTGWLFFASTIAEQEGISSYGALDSTRYPCCFTSILFMICVFWATNIEEEDKATKDSVFAKKMLEIKEQREAVEGEELRKERARQRARRRKAMRQEANERERALDYNSAIRIWEELGQIKEAARVRRLKARQSAIKVDQTVIHGDYVDDRDTTYIDDRDTIIKDSVLNRSNIGASGADKVGKIKELKELLDSGAIDAAEFRQMKKEILGE